MNEKPTRKKQPAVIRARLMEAAARLAVEEGVSGMTLDAVSRIAGVSKGGLLHHFPNRQALIEGLFDDLLQQLDCRMNEYIATDPEPRGRVVRAYLAVAAQQPGDRYARLLAALTLSMTTEPKLGELWRTWLYCRFGGEALTVGERIALCAADGIWLSHLIGGLNMEARQRRELSAKLVELTR